MIVTIEERINEVIESISPPPVQIGSDTYLDTVLSLKQSLERPVMGLAVLNADMVKWTNEDTGKMLDLLPRLKSLHVTCLDTVKLYTKSIYGVALKTTIEGLRIEARNLREIIDDVTNIHVTMKNDDDLQSLFRECSLNCVSGVNRSDVV